MTVKILLNKCSVYATLCYCIKQNEIDFYVSNLISLESNLVEKILNNRTYGIERIELTERMSKGNPLIA